MYSVYEYSSPHIGNTYSIDEITETMRAYLDADRLMQHRDVIFLAHSLGGIVVRGYITKHPTLADRIRLAYFLATPTTGSSVANVGSLISGNPQVDELWPMKSTAYLANLQRQWLAAQFKFSSYCSYEVKHTAGVLVVEHASASNLCTKPLDPVDTHWNSSAGKQS
jgi:pimeloyl-ACP methyl ester carboxylesterase